MEKLQFYAAAGREALAAAAQDLEFSCCSSLLQELGVYRAGRSVVCATRRYMLWMQGGGTATHSGDILVRSNLCIVSQTFVSRSPQLLRCACAQKWRTRPRVSTAKGCAAAASAALRSPRARRHTAWVSGHERRCHSSASTAAQPSHTTSAVSSSAEQPRISYFGLGLGLGY